MSLNKSKGNMYNNVVTWNPLGGECSHKCEYCSTKSFFYFAQKEKYSGELRICKPITDSLGRDKFIFVVAQNDLFANNVPDEFINRVLEHCRKFTNKYLFQSKNPQRMLSFDDRMPPDTIYCTTDGFLK
jgi:protein gp37